ncbi:MAG: hypothetical protein MPJ78_18915 [Hyphomicrobiaceae bacterium]|nr:hypothetical protein [Hyphomicrobiaceae bacterium]
MADEKKETGRTTRRTARTSRTTKRPARTIDLEAKEVPGEEAGTAKKGSAAPVAKSPEDAIKQDKASPGASAKKTDAKKTAAEDAQNTATTQPRTTGIELRSFATHLAAGLVGGLVGVVIGGVGIGQFSSGSSDSADRTGQEIAQLQSRLGALQTELDAQKKAVETAAKPPEVNKEDLSKVASRIAIVENNAAASASASTKEKAELSDRVAKLEDVLKAVQSSAGSGAGDAATLELSSRLAALSDALKKQKEGLDAEIAGLKASLAEGGGSAAAKAAADALNQRTKSLETQIAKLSSEVRAAEKIQTQRTRSDNEKGAALALAFEALRRAVFDGDPYVQQLDLFREYAPENLDLSGLSAYAKTGVPRQRTLLRELRPVLEAAVEAADKADDETFLDRLATNAQSIVRVRRIGPVQGDDTSAVLSRMEADMNASDLSGVLREATTLKGPALEAVKPWLAKAEMRQAAISAVNGVERELLKKHATDPDAAAKR